MNIDSSYVVEELEKGLGGEGNLVLLIGCRDCGANFEISKESAAMAIMTKALFIDYVRYVQNSNCTICKGKK